MPWGVVAAAVIGGVAQNQAAKKGAGAATDASNASILAQQQQYVQDRADRMPWMDAGKSALSQMQALNGGDFSSFYKSPDYEFARDQGLQGIDRSAAARGSMFSGGADADRMRFASGLASQNYGNFYSRLSDLANGGNATAASLGQNGMQTASNIGNSLMNAGNARATSYMQQGNNYAGMAGALGSAFGQWYQQRPSGNTPNNSYGYGSNTKSTSSTKSYGKP